KEKLAAVVLKELVDNALDAGASCHFDELEGRFGFRVEDDGPGLPGEDPDVAALFSIRRPRLSSKLLRLPTRGALGNGLRVVAGAVLGSAGRLEVYTQGQHLRLLPQDSGETLVEVAPADMPRGTRIEVTLGPGIPADPHHL